MMAPAESPGLYYKKLETGQLPQRALCPAAAKLSMQLQRYLFDEVKGRSCLIAGPRGAGKTTLVETAHADATRAVPDKRAILIRLHGPSLMTPPEPSAPVSEQRKVELWYSHILKSIIVNLYQTVAEEVAECYRARVAGGPSERLERAAQLRLVLDGAPSPSALREFWDAAGALESGVVFNKPSQNDQGMREIVMLASAAEAYRRCTGKLEDKNIDSFNAGRREELKAEAQAKGEEVRKALSGILTGVAAAGGASFLHAPMSLAVIAGAATALLGMATVSYSAGSSRKSTVRRDITFLPDTSVHGLLHRLPLLLRRFQQAGVLPVFVVDELDKVPRLDRRLNDLVSHLKFLCADNAFFCFLTDRAYLSAIAEKNRLAANGVLLTVFTDPLYVFYDTKSFRSYLKGITRVDGTADPGTEQELEFDLVAFHLALIHRSRMLVFNLVREISDQQKGEERLALERNQPREAPEFRIYVVLQLAIEATILSKALVGRLALNPEFAQVVYDVLYYPTARWQQGVEELDCTLGGVVSGMEEMAAAGAVTKFEGKSGLGYLAEDDQHLVHAHLLDYLGLVCDSGKLRQKLKEVKTDVHEVVCDVVNSSPRLLEPAGERGKFRWLIKPDGASFKVARLDELAEEADAAWIRAQTLAEELMGLRILPDDAEIMNEASQSIAVLQSLEAALIALAF